MKVTLFRGFSFEAAHRNMAAGAGSASSRLHGHSYRATVWLGGSIDNQLGWLRDFADIKSVCAPAIAKLDHCYLNELEGMRDTSLADVTRWLESCLREALPDVERCEVEIVGDGQFNPVIQPAGRQGARLAQVGFWFAAAHLLPVLPESHKCQRLHGHSFRVGITTSDAQELLKRLEGIYTRLDHHFLNEIPGLENPTSENLSRWLWEELAAAGSRPNEVVVRETCTTGCVYRGE
jgi:6-pyruvoyltetrahydropterin/6-carboxytetrahydropterin synthase